MANTQKKQYVSDLMGQLQENPHLVVVGFDKTSHKRLEELRGKLQSSGEKAPSFMVLKNSLFRLAFHTFNKKNKIVSDQSSQDLQDQVKGQAALMLIHDDWLSALKTIKDFAKDEEGFDFRVGLIDGKVYEQSGLAQLASLPGREELVVKIIMALKSPQTKLVYGMKFNSMKLVNVVRNAADKN
jgi:large subunit ribosomal protein L10